MLRVWGFSVDEDIFRALLLGAAQYTGVVIFICVSLTINCLIVVTITIILVVSGTVFIIVSKGIVVTEIAAVDFVSGTFEAERCLDVIVVVISISMISTIAIIAIISVIVAVVVIVVI